MKLSVVLATRNEETNIKRCLESVKSIADEIIVIDEESSDKTKQIAQSFGAKVITEPHHENFHITKQKALDMAKGEWILQLDADEVVPVELAKEIREVISGKSSTFPSNPLFMRHQKLIEKRDGKIGNTNGEVVGYFIPRRNMFLGKPLIHGGVYPDGVIRLVKNGFATFPQKSVHEQIKLEGRVSWLNHDLLHYDSPTLSKYLMRLNRYTDLQAQEMKEKSVSKNALFFIQYSLFKPFYTFCNLYFRHLGFLDGARGFLWSFFSASHFPVAYFKYLTKKSNGERAMKIAIDTGPLSSGHSLRGVGVYVRELLSALNLKGVDFSKTDLGDYDIAHFTSFNPFKISLPFSKPENTKFILTIYDLIPLIYPKHYPPGVRGWINWRINKFLIKKNVDAVITISETSKKDICRFIGVDPKKVYVTHLAPRKIFKKLEIRNYKLEIEKLNLPQRFALYVGDVNYNKNIPTLVKACEIAGISLVIAGKQAKEIEIMKLDHTELIHLKKLNWENVIRLGFVSDEDLVKIYNLAEVVIQPSFYEGFGLSVLEANASGVPVIASKTQALVEIAENSALFAKPNDPEDFADRIKLLARDAKLRNNLIKNGLLNAKKYSWEKTAKETLEIYKSV